LAKAKNSISKTTPKFWQRYPLLPERAQRLADKCYRLCQSNPKHRSIRFKQLEGHPTLYSARVGIHYRAIAQRRRSHDLGLDRSSFGIRRVGSPAALMIETPK
jgi:hypothetical protein